MKRVLTAVAISIFAALSIFAKTDNVEIRLGSQKTMPVGGIRVKFVSVIEDSRCPQGTQCIWAGNAKVRLRVSKGKKARTYDLDSTRGNTVINFLGYDIRFVDLNPAPGEKVKMAAKRKVLTVSITKSA